MDLNELKSQIQEGGIAGAGGAGFPSFAKLAAGADTLLVNGSECEPLLYTDFFLLKRELPTVLAGIEKLLAGAGIPKAVLLVKRHVAEMLGMKAGELAERISLKTLPDVYPVGDEVSLTYEATGRLIAPGKLPISVGVIVYNVETVYNIARKLVYGENVTMKWLTLGGDIPRPAVLRVPVGTPVSLLFKQFGVNVPEESAVLDGGPSMGKLIDYERAVVTKTTKGLLVLPSLTEAVRAKRTDAQMSVARAETACCQCTHCTDICPRALLGYPIEPHKLVRTARGAVGITPELALTAALCCGCGLCTSLACCQGISPKAVIDSYKQTLAAKKLRYPAGVQPRVSSDREYRMIPTERWERALGVKKYDKVPEFMGEATFSRVEVPLLQHIGAPSVPVVKAGASVEKGALIAEPQEGLSLPQHAPIAGTVSLGEGKIIIEKV